MGSYESTGFTKGGERYPGSSYLKAPLSHSLHPRLVVHPHVKPGKGDRDSELRVHSLFVPRCANKTHVEIHWQAASMTLNSKYKSLPLALCVCLSLLLS